MYVYMYVCQYVRVYLLTDMAVQSTISSTLTKTAVTVHLVYTDTFVLTRDASTFVYVYRWR